MRRLWMWMVPVLLVATAVGLGLLSGPLDAQQKNTLVARKAAAAPSTDGTMDAAWKAAEPLTALTASGRNLPGGSSDIPLRAVYTADTVYFHMQYKDPTDSVRREPWVKQADGSWMRLKDPNDKGGDNNLYYEDKMAVMWNISSPAFEQRGCFAACHTGEGKPYGNKYTANPGERLDMWHWKGVRGTIGQIDDQYVDHTRYDPDKAREAGRKSDPKTGGGYIDNVTDDKKAPRFALKGNKPAPPYWIIDTEKDLFDDGKYKAGDELPAIIVSPFTGDRGDIAAVSTWKDGTRTVVFLAEARDR